jgi:sugar phosphate isomerase/epimerase
LELACWGDHFEVDKAVSDKNYCQKKRELLKKYGLEVYAISHHLAGQLVCDVNDKRAHAFAPAGTHGHPEKIREWAVETMKNTARAAARLGIEVVNGFTGSSIWHLLYSFPPADPADVEAGFQFFAEKWNPILDVFEQEGVRFGLEVHPTEIAYDVVTTERALKAVDHRPEFGFNFDPSHLHWQGVDPVVFLKEFSDRIYHVHMKDAAVTLDGRSGIISSHLNFGDPRRGWDFRSLGHGEVDFESIVRTLNQIGYEGPLSVEWEDSGMEREHGAAEACRFVRDVDFPSSKIAFDAAFEQ